MMANQKKTPSVESSVRASFESPASAVTDIKENYGNKLVYILCQDEHSNSADWVVVDPHQEGKDENQIGEMKFVPEMQFPAHLDLSKILLYSPPVHINSKLYIVGGRYDDDGLSVYSPKMFIYDFISKKWEEGQHHLKRARAFPDAVGIGSVIYVFGGTINYNEEKVCMEEWCEFYDVNNSDGWQFLQTPIPSSVVKDSWVFHAVHERGNQILLWLQKAGVYSFNYDTKSWSAFDPILSTVNSLACYDVAVVGDVLFWHYFGVIYSYDLRKREMLFSNSLDNSKTKFGIPLTRGDWPDQSFLIRAGQDTLFLIFWDGYSPLKKLHCYRFRIQESSSLDDSRSGPGECDFYLFTDGCGMFHAPGAFIISVVVV